MKSGRKSFIAIFLSFFSRHLGLLDILGNSMGNCLQPPSLRPSYRTPARGSFAASEKALVGRTSGWVVDS